MAAASLWAARVRFHEGERRRFYGDVFELPNGDVNVVYLTPNVPIAWHRHQHQDDHLWLISGLLRVRWFSEETGEHLEHAMVALPGARKVVTIPMGWWHGYCAVAKNTVVLQFNGPGKYDGSDEERKSLKDKPWD